MTQLSIIWGGGNPSVQIRESPTKASLGRTTMSANGTDNDCDSFFDIFTEVSTDGGKTWQPAAGGPATVTLEPRPIATPVPITIQLVATNKVVLTWPSTPMVLQRAPHVTGQWTTLPGATSPYTNVMSGEEEYFRLKEE